MKKIKVFIFLLIFFWFYNALASNIPLGYWGNNFTKNNEINNTKYNIPLGYIGNNFNKKLTYTGILNQTPIGFFADYKGQNLELPKLNKIITITNTNTGNTTINEVNNNTGSLDNTNILKEKIRQNKINNLEKRIALAKASGEIYTYRLREYIKNDDGSFTNIDTLNPYGGNINNLKLKIKIIKEIKKIPPINNITTDFKDNTNIKIISNSKISINNEDIIKNNEKLVNKINEDIKKKQELQIKKDLEIRQKMQEKQDKINRLENRIALAKASGEIYTYRLREYIKNSDGSFINIDTLRPYSGNIDNLKKKSYEIEKISIKKKIKKKYKKYKKYKKKTSKNKIESRVKFIKNNKKYKTKNTKQKIKSNKKEIYKLKTKVLYKDILYVYNAKQKLIEIKKNNFEEYLILKSCFLEEICTNINYFNKIKEDITNSINIEYLAKRLDININNNESLDYINMLKVIIKVFGKDKYFNSNILKNEYSKNIDKMLLNTFKKDKNLYNKVDYLSYKRIYFNILENITFKARLNKLLFNK